MKLLQGIPRRGREAQRRRHLAARPQDVIRFVVESPTRLPGNAIQVAPRPHQPVVHAPLPVGNVVDVYRNRDTRTSLIFQAGGEVCHLFLRPELRRCRELPPDFRPFAGSQHLVDPAARHHHGVLGTCGNRSFLLPVLHHAVLAPRRAQVNGLRELFPEQRGGDIHMAYIPVQKMRPDDQILEARTVGFERSLVFRTLVHVVPRERIHFRFGQPPEIENIHHFVQRVGRVTVLSVCEHLLRKQRRGSEKLCKVAHCFTSVHGESPRLCQQC